MVFEIVTGHPWTHKLVGDVLLRALTLNNLTITSVPLLTTTDFTDFTEIIPPKHYYLKRNI